MQTSSLLMGRDAFQRAAMIPPRKLSRSIGNGDTVIIPSLSDATKWFYAPIRPNGPEVFFCYAEVVRNQDGVKFSCPVYISMLHKEIEDIDGKRHQNTVVGIDLEFPSSLLGQFELVAGKRFHVTVSKAVVVEQDRNGNVRPRKRNVYTWTPLN